MIEDEGLLASFRGKSCCEQCGTWQGHREPHHLWKRQMGGGARIDLPFNLISLCAGFGSNWCHRKAEDGHITKDALLAIVAAREGMQVETITEAMNRLLWGRKP